jgi:hypothetical protein
MNMQLGRLALPLILLAVGTVSAYAVGHGPFEEGEAPPAFALIDCVATNLTHGDRDGFPCSASYMVPDSPPGELRIELCYQSEEGGMLKAIDASGRPVAEIELSGCPHARSLLPNGTARVQSGDFNGDGKKDFVATVWLGGCGLATGYHDQIFVLSRETGYVARRLVALFPSAADFVDVNQDGVLDLVHTTFVYGKEKSPDGKLHNYWVYNLLTVEGDRLVLANELDDRFRKWVYYSFKDNHKETEMLTQAQKDRHWEREKRQLLDYLNEQLPGAEDAQ